MEAEDERRGPAILLALSAGALLGSAGFFLASHLAILRVLLLALGARLP